MIRATLACAVLFAALGSAGAAPSVKLTDARAHDGRWSVEIVTQRGDCDRAYRYAIVIENGQARYTSTDFEVKGKVQPTGAVQASISRGGDRADVVGDLGDGLGRGTWTTSGARVCGGTWTAERRS